MSAVCMRVCLGSNIYSKSNSLILCLPPCGFQRMKRAILVAYNVSGKTRNKEAMSKLTESDREMIKGE